MAGVRTDDGIAFGDGYGIAENFQVSTIVLGSISGLGNGIGDGIL